MVEVPDASVAIKWFVDEPGREKALSLLAQIISDPTRFCVPELFYFELIHIFNRLVRKPSQTQKRLLETVVDLGMTRFAMTGNLCAKISLLQGLGLSGYDAAYVAVAQEVSGVWITFDTKAHRKIASLKVSRCL
ncbi:MAG: type II toxin-antitoxin system VapC family toxin [Deltaproteobacteria bacterium]|nr:type II toxin-antitoxin system VapC family toxin [Deltaproteobacteria bacterium]